MAKKKVEVVEEPQVEVVSAKAELIALYETLISLNIRSISDLENLIARAE